MNVSAHVFTLLVLVGACAHAASFSFSHGPLELTFDEGTGALLRIARGNEVIAEDGPNRSPTSFGFGPAGASTWLEQLKPGRKLVGRSQPSPDRLELTIRVGDFEVVEGYRLFADAPRLDRSATLVNRGTQTVKLRAFTFRTPGVKATKDGFYRFPKQWPPRSHPFAAMKPGTRHSGGLSIAPLLAQLADNRTLLWAACTDDSPHVRVEEATGKFDVVQGIGAAGYLKPGEPQQVGFLTMQVVDAGYWGALPKLWEWFDSVGVKVPADVPLWLSGAVLYSFHPGGTIGSNFTDLGGFKAATEYLLPTLPKLGVTAIWIMPIEYKSPYWPLDYYRFQDGLGTADEFKALVKRAHELGLKVLLDLVPHGGAPHAVHNKAHPEFMLRREDGSHLNYWLNDFARPDWQDTIAKVAAHYIREYDVDGYRIDACYGSKEPNWDPAIPYARASHAGLKGGLQMVKRIRDEVKKLKPKDGAVLAEVESARHAAVSDLQYDFGLCYTVLQAWRHMPADEYVPLLQEYLQEQKYVNPRGTVFLRHIESHDSLRSQGWYGVQGMEALYALAAWIDGVPLIYQGMEIGHSFALRQINELRTTSPALARGEALHRAAKCDNAELFACARQAGDNTLVACVNLGRNLMSANVRWGNSHARVHAGPAEYRLARLGKEVGGRLCAVGGPLEDTKPWEGDSIDFPTAAEWSVATAEGGLRDTVPSRFASAEVRPSSIYWRPQHAEVLWRSAVAPLNPRRPHVEITIDAEKRQLVCFGGQSPPGARLEVAGTEKRGLRLAGLHGVQVGREEIRDRPTELRESRPCLKARDFARHWSPFPHPRGSFRVVGPDYIVSNKHFTCVLRRQGGVIRELFVGGKVVAKDHDLYGDQAHFELPHARRIQAANDVECGIRTWKADDGLHLSFEGQLRGFNRFALKRPPLWYRNEYVFADKPTFTQKWAFRTEKSFKDKTAFLASFLLLPDADRFRFSRDGEPLADDAVGEGGARRGQTTGAPAPGRIEFLKDGKPLFGLAGLKTPEGSTPNVFAHGRQFFITLLDGKGAQMEAGKWYEFSADWQVK